MFKKLSLCLLLGISSSAFAYQSEITGGASLGYSFAKYDAGTTGVLSTSLGYGAVVSENFEINLDTIFGFTHNFGTTEWVLQAVAGPTFNFGADAFADTFFIGLRSGVLRSLGDMMIPLYATLGKRFAITESISYKPYVNVGMYFSPTAFHFQVVPLSFSLVF